MRHELRNEIRPGELFKLLDKHDRPLPAGEAAERAAYRLADILPSIDENGCQIDEICVRGCHFRFIPIYAREGRYRWGYKVTLSTGQLRIERVLYDWNFYGSDDALAEFVLLFS